jgi:hypothetical protein
VVGTETTATSQAMQAALPALSSGDPEAAARALHTVLSAVLNSINSGDAATGTKALHAALKINPTHDEATLLLQELLQLHKTKQPQQQQQQQLVANGPASLATTAITSSSSSGVRRSSGGGIVASSSNSIVVQGPATITFLSNSNSITSSSAAGSTPPAPEPFDFELDAISSLIFGRRDELLAPHYRTFDGSTTLSSEWVAEALRLKQQMVSSHACNMVGWWCSLLDYLTYFALFCCLHVARWAGE